MKIKKILLSGCLMVTLFACATHKKSSANAASGDLQKLVTMMCGDFSSQAQSQRDSDFFDIRLHIHPIWAADKANHWLYIEQATASAQQKPYRQRIYKVENDGKGGFRSIVYTLPTPEKWIGGHQNPAIFDQIKPSDLTLRDGCTVFLKKMPDGSFAGKTEGEGCESNIRGAKYAVSTVTITPTMLKSWDQGFDASGKQVWGAVKGGYEFVKQ